MLRTAEHNSSTEGLPGFEHINRFIDRRNGQPIAKILPGEYYVSNQDEIIATVLGSCISVCIRDPVTGVGGMNHFMLPERSAARTVVNDFRTSDQATRYGTYAMEHMINDILKHGGNRNRFEIKICGGGKIIKSMTDIGSKNINFAKAFLKTEGYEIFSEDVGDIYPRKVRYYPISGRLLVKKLHSMHNRTIIDREQALKSRIENEAVTGGEVELF